MFLGFLGLDAYDEIKGILRVHNVVVLNVVTHTLQSLAVYNCRTFRSMTLKFIKQDRLKNKSQSQSKLVK